MNEALYAKLKDVAVVADRTFYSDIAPMVGLDMMLPGDRNKMSALLDEISIHEHDNGRPLLSAVVISVQHNIPGDGFFKMAKRIGVFDGKDNVGFFVDELRRVHDYWQKHGSR